MAECSQFSKSPLGFYSPSLSTFLAVQDTPSACGGVVYSVTSPAVSTVKKCFPCQETYKDVPLYFSELSMYDLKETATTRAGFTPGNIDRSLLL